MSSSPLQFVNACTYTHPSIGQHPMEQSKAEAPDMCPHRLTPSHARHLVGKCYRDYLEGAPRHELGEPGIFPRLLHGPSQDGVRADDENATQIAVASLGDRSKLMLASARFLPWHQSIHAAKSRPDRKTVGSATVAAIAVAPMMPMPGMVSSRWLAGLARCCILICSSSDPISICSALSCAASKARLARASTGNRPSSSSATIISNSVTCPCRKSDPDVTMVQSAGDRQRENATY